MKLKIGDVVRMTNKRSKRKGKLGKVDHIGPNSDFVLVLWQNLSVSFAKTQDLEKVEDAPFVFDVDREKEANEPD